jgi:putative endonuclease
VELIIPYLHAAYFLYCKDQHALVYFELFETMEEAILREKRLKNWHRAWKERLINSINTQWLDLYDGLF